MRFFSCQNVCSFNLLGLNTQVWAVAEVSHGPQLLPLSSTSQNHFWLSFPSPKFRSFLAFKPWPPLHFHGNFTSICGFTFEVEGPPQPTTPALLLNSGQELCRKFFLKCFYHSGNFQIGQGPAHDTAEFGTGQGCRLRKCFTLSIPCLTWNMKSQF